ncbi:MULTISPECIES: hypothetical protein [Leuconostoc]|uniref:hypothetical protein n=1 Tax=Leuconostoc TaxID=1243 RepID=UPI0032DFD3AF
MNYEQYQYMYNKDDHRRKDALPKPLIAKRLAAELNRRHQPNQTTIRSQLLLTQLFGISMASLVRFQHLITNQKLHKYMTLNGQKNYLKKRSQQR